MLDSELSKRHFTDSARKVVRHVSERAWDRGMHAGELTDVTAEMLAILSMLHWERKVGKVAWERVSPNWGAFAQELDEAIEEEGLESQNPNGRKTKMLPSGQLAIVMDHTTPLMPLLDKAEHEAIEMGRDYVGTEHLMLAAIRRPCPRLQELLRRYGVTYDIARQAVIDVLAERFS